jgi:hypothetical protein
MKMRASICIQAAVSLLFASVSVVADAQNAPPGAPQSDSKTSAAQTPHGMHKGNHGCCNPKTTSGWSMMNKEEREEHFKKMREMKSFDECKAYADEHHAKMKERAKERQRKLPEKPHRNMCAWLKK